MNPSNSGTGATHGPEPTEDKKPATDALDARQGASRAFPQWKIGGSIYPLDHTSNGEPLGQEA